MKCTQTITPNTEKKGATDGPTCSRNTLLRPSSVVVLHPHRRDHHRPDATGAPALRRRGRQWHDHCSQRRAVVVVEVTVRTVGARGRRRVRRRRALHRVAAALRTLVLGHAGEQRGDTERRLLQMLSVILTRGLKRRRRKKKVRLPVGSLARRDRGAGLQRVGGEGAGAEAALGAAERAHPLHGHAGVSARLARALRFTPVESARRVSITEAESSTSTWCTRTNKIK